MEDDAETADLVLVIGTSLGGLSADQVPNDTAERSESDKPYLGRNGGALGAVIINLQQTTRDGGMTLKISGKSDDVLRKVVKELGVDPVPAHAVRWNPVNSMLVPYDRNGKLLPKNSAEPKMWLDFSDQAKVKICPGHNIQGAKQPIYMHIGRKKPYKGRAPGMGHGVVIRREETHWVLSIDGAGMRLGVWWLESAQSGALPFLPLVNLNPEYEGEHLASGASVKKRLPKKTATNNLPAKKPSKKTHQGSALVPGQGPESSRSRPSVKTNKQNSPPKKDPTSTAASVKKKSKLVRN